MRTGFLVGRALLGAAFMCSCNAPHSLAVKDSEGRRFTASYSSDGTWRLAAAARPSTDTESPFELTHEGRVVGVCEKPDHNAYDCRPLRCQAADDCPRAPDLGSDCSHGYCVDPAREFTRDDIIMLCMAGTGTGHDLAPQRERYARALESGTPPHVPAGCPAP